MEINIIIKTLPKYVTADISPKPTVDMVTCQSTEINVSQYHIKQFTTNSNCNRHKHCLLKCEGEVINMTRSWDKEKF